MTAVATKVRKTPIGHRTGEANSLRVLAKQADDAAQLLKLLGNEKRLLILCFLADRGEMTVGELVHAVKLSQSALSQHLAVLRAARVVRTRRQSQVIWYELAPGPANHVMEALYTAFCAPVAVRARRRIRSDQ